MRPEKITKKMSDPLTRHVTRLGCNLRQILQNMICAFSIGRKIGGKKIWEEERFQNCKHNKKLDKNQFPQGAANNHGAKTIVVK